MNAFAFYVVLILCYFPMFMFLILYRNSIYNTFYWNPEWHFIGTVVFMNSSINPILCYWRLGELRKAIQKTARTIFFRKQDSAEQTVSNLKRLKVILSASCLPGKHSLDEYSASLTFRYETELTVSQKQNLLKMKQRF